MGDARARLLAVSMSTGVGLVLAYFALRGRFEEPPTVRLVENADEVADLFLAREGVAREGVAQEGAAREGAAQEGAAREGAAREGAARESPLQATAVELASTEPAVGPLVRTSLTQKQVAKLYAKKFKTDGLLVYDPDTWFWEQPGRTWKQRFSEHPRKRWWIKTNDWGCRQPADIREDAPDLRILVTGDSHTCGVVPFEENFAIVLQDALAERAPDRSVEGINAGKGGFDFYNYVGVMDKFVDLDPDVFVLAVFGGNDFMACVRPYRFFNGLPPLPTPKREEWRIVVEVDETMRGLIPQDVNQLMVFRRSPVDAEYAAIAAKQTLVTLLETCAEREIQFVLVLIPPCSDVQREIIQPEFDDAVRRLHLSEADLAVTGRLCDRFLADAAELGVQAIDMRPHFAASEAPCYWRSDLHINTLGHALVARELEAVLKDRLED